VHSQRRYGKDRGSRDGKTDPVSRLPALIWWIYCAHVFFSRTSGSTGSFDLPCSEKEDTWNGTAMPNITTFSGEKHKRRIKRTLGKTSLASCNLQLS